MTDNTQQTIDGIPLAVGTSPDDHWIDAHSVTCPLCGGYADERETIDLWSKDKYPNGETHQNCYQYAEEHDIERAKEDLAALVTPK